jgi:propanol-preferring alcohol dehydrogenase
VLKSFGDPLSVEEVDDLRPGPGEVTIHARAAGVCRTDVKVMDGVIPSVSLPIIPGHELAGEIAEVGFGVTGVAQGDRVLATLDLSCETCSFCLDGKPNFCSNLRRLGIEADGAFAEIVAVPAVNLHRIPDNLSFPEAATIPDAVAAPYHAVVGHARVHPGQTVAVYGLGGLGLAAVQVSRLCGARVIAIARTPERRALSEELGATWSIDPRDAPVGTQILELTKGLGVDAFIDVVGIESSFREAAACTRKGGVIVVVGYLAPEMAVPTASLIMGEISIVGSRTATAGEVRNVISLVADGALRPIIDRELPLSDINSAIDGLRAGEVIGRSVVTFS